MCSLSIEPSSKANALGNMYVYVPSIWYWFTSRRLEYVLLCDVTAHQNCYISCRRNWYLPAPKLENYPPLTLHLMSVKETLPGRRNFTFHMQSKKGIWPTSGVLSVSSRMLTKDCSMAFLPSAILFSLQFQSVPHYLLVPGQDTPSPAGLWKILSQTPFLMDRGNCATSFSTPEEQERERRHSG